MTHSFKFFVHGNPAPKGSYKTAIQDGRIHLIGMSKREQPWRGAIVREIWKYGNPPRIPRKASVFICENFYIPRGKSVKREQPTVPPDIDKLQRCLHDAITDSLLWGDDSQITEVYATKDYADDHASGVFVLIRW